jgi:IclR helix-turn-helix domain
MSSSDGSVRRGPVGVLASGRGVTITLSDSQIEQVVSDIAEDPCLSTWMGGDIQPSRELESLLADARYCRSLLRAFLVLGAFPADEDGRELTDVARELGLPASTIHRYATTLMTVGLLAQNPHSRRYRRPPRDGRTVAEQTPAAGNER